MISLHIYKLFAKTLMCQDCVKELCKFDEKNPTSCCFSVCVYTDTVQMCVLCDAWSSCWLVWKMSSSLHCAALIRDQHAHTHVHTQTDKLIHIHGNTHSHAHTRSHTDTHAHTHSQTHTLVYSYFSVNLQIISVWCVHEMKRCVSYTNLYSI